MSSKDNMLPTVAIQMYYLVNLGKTSNFKCCYFSGKKTKLAYCIMNALNFVGKDRSYVASIYITKFKNC